MVLHEFLLFSAFSALSEAREKLFFFVLKPKEESIHRERERELFVNFFFPERETFEPKKQKIFLFGGGASLGKRIFIPLHLSSFCGGEDTTI